MKKLLLLIGICSAFAVGYGAAGHAFPAAGMYGRGEYNGYFTNVNDTNGTYVLPNQFGGEAYPSSINSATEFINFIRGTEGLGGNAQQRTGAAFLIQTMIGSSRNRPPTGAEVNEWIRRVNAAQAAGRITWRTNYSYCINSFYQGPRGGGSPNDDAFFDDCGTQPAMVFRDASGNVAYAIKWLCSNPVGNVRPIPDDLNFNMGGSAAVNDSTPIPGQTITFTYRVVDNGPGASTAITAWGINTLTGAVTRGPVGLGIFSSAGQAKFFSETYTVPLSAVPGDRICRNPRYTPNTEDGGVENGASVCAVVQYSFTLRPAITATVNGAPLPAGSVAEVGDTLQFTYSIVNTGLTESTNASCFRYGKDIDGYHTVPTPEDSTAGWASFDPAECPRVFPKSSTTPITSANETFAILPGNVNRSICRQLVVNPATFGGGPDTFESCVQVGAKPYFRAYKGDVSAGNGFPTTCTTSNSSIVAWNKENPSFSGAGTQYAAYAMNRVHDFATAYGNTAGAVPGTSLAFANTTAVGASIFGGLFGSLPCVPDYYARRTLTTTQPLPSGNLPSLPNGLRSFTATGPITVHGNVTPGQQSVIYVDGDVLIDGDITYAGSWNINNMPLLQLVVRGNIYISENVTQLDGIYIAQPSTATNGIIFTCANPGLPGIPVATTDPLVFSRCRNTLTINGSFIARQVQLLRTRGTLSQSSSLEAPAGGNIAEVFNYSPATWIQQPPVPSDMMEGYDAITSLPPVL
ncbi:MAG TPA: hypothetical protein VLE73_06745 [Candidatus Saccharimonadales bacterium]|nr:hypothetical protein [Candidatus Saccharimonadales bacterium]